MDDLIPFGYKLRNILKERKISHVRFEMDTGIRRGILYATKHRHHRSTLMAIAYYLKMDVEALVEDTDAMDDWYR